MADDKIERIVEGEDVGYVADSDDENHEDEGISARSFTEVCSITCKTTDIKQESSFHNSDSRKNQGRAVDIRTKVVGMDKGQGPGLDVTRDQISLATEVGELALDQEAEFSLRCSENLYRDKTLSKVNRSRIRKLYNEVTSGAKEEPLCETGIYIGSQEPGELSQAIAMNVVDKLIPDNDEGSCQYIGPRKTMGSSSPPILIVKGAQHLAKWANRRSSVIESRTFDWVENLADDGKGNCFSERTEFFSESQGNPERSHKPTSKPAYSSGINTASVDMSRKKKSGSISYPNTISLGPPWTPNLVPGISSTDELHKSETESNNLFAVADAQLLSEPPEQQVEVADVGVVEEIYEESNNLFAVADAQFLSEPPEQQVEVADVGVVEEIYDIGPNTQIAAEAMEALFHGSPVNYELDEITNPKNVNLVEDSYIGMPLNKTLVNHGSKRVTSTYALEGNLICYKRRKALSNKINKGSPSSSRNYSNNLRVKNKVDNMKEKTKVKRAKWEHKAHLQRGCAANANELTVSSNPDKESGPVDCKSSKEVDKSGISSNTQVSGTRRLMIGNLPYVVSVAPRTRRSKYVKMSNWTSTFSDYGKAFSVPTETSNPGPKLEDEKCVTNTCRSRSSERKGVSEGLNQVSKLDNNASYTEVQVIDNQWEANLKTSFFKTGAYIPANSRNLHPITSGKSTIFAKPKNLSPSVSVHPASIVQPSTWYGEGKAIVKNFHQILGTVKRKRRSDSRRISSVSSHSLKPYSEKDFKKCKTDFSEVGLTPRNIAVISHLVSSIEVASLEMAAAPASDAQGTKVNAKADIDPPIRKPRNTLKVSHSKHASKSSIARELIRLEATEPAATWLLKDLRRRKDMSKVRVLFSNHLEDDVIKQQKKILARFKAPIASSAADATHFIADRFARTKNMLEAMAMGKPVVTHLWLDSCARTSYFIDERNYLLRDLKKEKEIGFSMHVSLARAHQHPLLQGKRVFITPNVKPDTEVVESLVKAAHGQIHPVVRGHGKVNDKIPDDLLVISCEEDYAACAYLLNKGVEVFSSDLILNGIIIQKLEFDRYQLFVNHVKRSS